MSWYYAFMSIIVSRLKAALFCFACLFWIFYLVTFYRQFSQKRTYYLSANLNLFSLKFNSFICCYIWDLSSPSKSSLEHPWPEIEFSQWTYFWRQRAILCALTVLDILHVHSDEPDIHFKLVSDTTSRLNFWYCDKTYHNTTFISLNAASLNVIVSKRKSFKT
jgi:hypothetical protein